MKKKLSIGYIIIFLALTVLPYLLYLFIAKYLDLENHENHTLVTMNDVLQSPWNEKTGVLENFLDDYLPYKNEMTYFNTWIDINVFKSLDSDSVLLGKDNWLFYKKDNCIEDYCGRMSVSQEDIEAMIFSMQNLQNYCNENGIELVFMVTPNKETIYGEWYMPDYVKVLNKESRADALIQAIKNQTDINIVFPKQELLEKRDVGYQVYKKYVTHWNMLGGYIGTMSLFEAIHVEMRDIEELEVRGEKSITGDLANMIAMSNALNDDIDYTITGYKDNVEVSLIEEREEPNLKYSHFQSNVSNGQTIVCIGDSFLEMTEEYIAKNYAQSYFMHISNYKEGTIEEAQPDVLVITSTERAFPGLHWSIDSVLEKLGIE